MQYGQTTLGASETRGNWKPIKQMSYKAKLNSFAAEHACDHMIGGGCDQQQCWSPNYSQTNCSNNM